LKFLIYILFFIIYDNKCHYIQLLQEKNLRNYFIKKNFYKITNEKEYHYNFQYKDGLNEDTIKFNPSGECNIGGLYFIELNKIGL